MNSITGKYVVERTPSNHTKVNEFFSKIMNKTYTHTGQCEYHTSDYMHYPPSKRKIRSTGRVVSSYIYPGYELITLERFMEKFEYYTLTEFFEGKVAIRVTEKNIDMLYILLKKDARFDNLTKNDLGHYVGSNLICLSDGSYGVSAKQPSTIKTKLPEEIVDDTIKNAIYKLKKDWHEPAVKALLGADQNRNVDIISDKREISRLREAMVLDLWFEEEIIIKFKIGDFVRVVGSGSQVYTVEHIDEKNKMLSIKHWENAMLVKFRMDQVMLLTEREVKKELSLPEIRGYQGVDIGEYLKYGCANLNKDWFESSNNRFINSITLNNGVMISGQEINKIRKYLYYANHYNLDTNTSKVNKT